MPLNLALGALGGVLGAVVGGGTSAFAAWRAGEAIRFQDVAAGVAGGATTGFIGGSTLGLGLLPMIVGGEVGAVAGLGVASLILWRRPTATEVAATAVAGVVAAGAFAGLLPSATTASKLIVSGAVAGSTAGGASQVTANVLDRRPVLENAEASMLLGGAVGGGTVVLGMGVTKTVAATVRAVLPSEPPPPSRPASRGMIGMLTPADLAARARALSRLELDGSDDAIKVWKALRDDRLVLLVGRPEDTPLQPGQMRIADPAWSFGEPDGMREFIWRALAVLRQAERSRRGTPAG